MCPSLRARAVALRGSTLDDRLSHRPVALAAAGCTGTQGCRRQPPAGGPGTGTGTGADATLQLRRGWGHRRGEDGLLAAKYGRLIGGIPGWRGGSAGPGQVDGRRPARPAGVSLEEAPRLGTLQALEGGSTCPCASTFRYQPSEF